MYTGDGERVPALDGLHRLEEIAALSHLPGDALLHPRKRVTVMIIGNHSAGKSSFINWYCEQAVLATGVAVESQGFTVITHGRDPTPIKGEGTIIENKHLKAVADRLGKDRTTFVEYLSTVGLYIFYFLTMIETRTLNQSVAACSRFPKHGMTALAGFFLQIALCSCTLQSPRKRWPTST